LTAFDRKPEACPFEQLSSAHASGMR